MWTTFVVLLPPFFKNALRLFETAKELAVCTFVSKFIMEAFDVPLLPGRAWRDVERFDLPVFQPVLDRIRDELGAVI